MTISPWTGRSKTGFMLYKKFSHLYHPYIYKEKQNAEKEIGWFGDEVHKVRIVRVKEKRK